MNTKFKALPNDYSALMIELYRRAAAQRQPVSGTFELTERCNLSCNMCYIRQPPSNLVLRNKELSAVEWLQLANQAVDNGMVFLLLTGGEVFLRPDFFDLYIPLTRLGLLITLFSNGTLINDAIAARLADVPPSRVEITLYGGTAKTYEAVTGVKGSFSRCCTGIESLAKRNIPLVLKSTITQQNVNEIELMGQMAHNWGTSFAANWLISQRRDGVASSVTNSRLSADDCISLESSNQAFASEWREVALRENAHTSDDNFYCLAGKTSFVINSQGKMNACIDLPLPAASTLEAGFRTAWEQVQNFVDSAPPTSPVCNSCNARPYCPRCPAWSQLETNTLDKPVPYLCEIAHTRMKKYSA